MSKKLTQKDVIKEYLQTGTPISDGIATAMGIKRLSAIISTLRKEQWVFTSKNIARPEAIPNCEYTVTFNPTTPSHTTTRAYVLECILHDNYPVDTPKDGVTKILADVLCWCEVNNQDPVTLANLAKNVKETAQ
jgi:hypothetical protein